MLKEMSNKGLLDGVLEAVRVEKRSTARVLEYLVEIDTRRLWLGEGYSSLHDFCVRHLNYSEGEAGRRIQAARCSAQIQEIQPLLERNEISLSGVSLIAPYVTKSNAAVLLTQVCKKSTREIEAILIQHFPEAGIKDEFFKAPLDEELRALLAEAHKEISEKNETVFLKRILRRFLAPKPPTVRPSKHTRYVSKQLRQQVKAAAQHRCSYRAASGIQCNQTAHLEIDHIRPWAKGGSSRDLRNLRVLCKAHNLLAARRDFPGRKFTRPPLAREIEMPLAVSYTTELPFPVTL